MLLTVIVKCKRKDKLKEKLKEGKQLLIIWEVAKHAKIKLSVGNACSGKEATCVAGQPFTV